MQERHMKDFVRDVFQMFVYLIGGLMLGVLAFIVLQYPVKIGFEGIKVTAGGAERNLSAFVLMFLEEAAGLAALFLLSRRIGYRENTPDAHLWTPYILITTAVACGIYVLLILITNFSWSFLYLDTLNMMQLIFGKRELNGIGIAELRGAYRMQGTVTLMIHALLYMLPMNLGYIFGAKKRITDRTALTNRGN